MIMSFICSIFEPKTVQIMVSSLGIHICQFLSEHPEVSSKEIHEGIKMSTSYATVKRELTNLLAGQLITISGQGKATRYALHAFNALLIPLDPNEYLKQDIDQRKIKNTYDFELIKKLSGQESLFTTEDKTALKSNQDLFKKRITNLSKELYKKEFERLSIDLSWKSSQIEGNTYTLLETERLLQDNITASGKTKDEATMLLNHKKAIDFIVENPDIYAQLSIRSIEEIHSLLISDLHVSRNIRHSRVGITGTNYRPLDNEYQIREALEDMSTLINRKNDIFEKALLVLVLISYIQPFEDGNKRTARIMCNAILLHHGFCPLSFRTVDPIAYKEAMLIFYEQNNISAIKKIFIDQYAFAVNTYF